MHLNEQVAEKEETSESYLSEHPLIFFRKFDYWGGVLLTAALAIFFVTRGLHGSQVPVEPPKPLPQVVQVQEVLPIEFPALKLSGLVCNGLKSTAVIDGVTVRVGGSVKGVKLVTVEPDGVIVELDGSQKRLIQEEASNQPPQNKGR